MAGFSSCAFSEAIEQSSGLVYFSPASIASGSPKYIAVAAGNRILVRDIESLRVVQIFSCIDKVERMEWSPDGQYIYAAFIQRGSVQVFAVADAKWSCRMNEGTAGLLSCRWSPDSRHLVLESDFGIQISIWSLLNGKSQLISHPKSTSGAGNSLIVFSPCGRFLACGLRIELQDFIGVYSVENEAWVELSKFKCKGGGNNLASISWAPDGSHIIAIDSPLVYKVVVYTPSGDVVSSFEAYQNALGIKQMSIHASVPINSSGATSKSSIAIGSYDAVVRLLSPISFKCAFELPLIHPRDYNAGLIDQTAGILTTVEVNDATVAEANQASLSGIDLKKKSIYVSRNLKSLPRNAPDPNARGSPKFGAFGLNYSADGTLLVAREESMPRCIWLWDVERVKLVAVIVQLENVLQARWQPNPELNKNVIAFCTGTPRVYFWVADGSHGNIGDKIARKENGETDEICPSISGTTFWSPLPDSDSFQVMNLRWNAAGNKIVAIGRDRFCCCDIMFNSDYTGVKLEVSSSI